MAKGDRTIQFVPTGEAGDGFPAAHWGAFGLWAAGLPNHFGNVRDFAATGLLPVAAISALRAELSDCLDHRVNRPGDEATAVAAHLLAVLKAWPAAATMMLAAEEA